jgi:hypothetical protein
MASCSSSCSSSSEGMPPLIPITPPTNGGNADGGGFDEVIDVDDDGLSTPPVPNAPPPSPSSCAGDGDGVDADSRSSSDISKSLLAAIMTSLRHIQSDGRSASSAPFGHSCPPTVPTPGVSNPAPAVANFQNLPRAGTASEGCQEPDPGSDGTAGSPHPPSSTGHHSLSGLFAALASARGQATYLEADADATAPGGFVEPSSGAENDYGISDVNVHCSFGPLEPDNGNGSDFGFHPEFFGFGSMPMPNEDRSCMPPVDAATAAYMSSSGVVDDDLPQVHSGVYFSGPRQAFVRRRFSGPPFMAPRSRRQTRTSRTLRTPESRHDAQPSMCQGLLDLLRSVVCCGSQ